MIDLSDGVAVLLHLFLGAAPPACPDAADSNDDGRVDVSDVIHTLRYLFLSSGSVPVPGPAVSGPDPTADDLTPCEYPPGSCE